MLYTFKQTVIYEEGIILSKISTVSLFIVGIINFLPIVGLLGSKSLESAYGIKLSSSDLILLMQHRALLFGLLGGFILYSIIKPVYQPAAMCMAAISMVGFAVLVHLTGVSNSSITKVLYIDYIGILFLLVAIVFKYNFVSEKTTS